MDLLGIAIVAAAFVVFGLVYRHRRASCAGAADHCTDPCAECPEHRPAGNVSESNHAHS